MKRVKNDICDGAARQSPGQIDIPIHVFLLKNLPQTQRVDVFQTLTCLTERTTTTVNGQGKI